MALRDGTLRLFSIDHGAHDLVPLAAKLGADPSRLPAFKVLAVEAATAVANGRAGYGMFLEFDIGGAALQAATGSGLFVTRQYPHGDPRDPAAVLATWPASQVVKVIANARADARTPLAIRRTEIQSIAAVCRHSRRPFLVEALAALDATTAQLLADLARDGLAPTWWLVEAQPTLAAWRDVAAIAARQPCKGLVMIVRSNVVEDIFATAAGEPSVRGFVGGRALFGQTLEAWLLGSLDDTGAREDLTRRFREMAGAWDKAARGDVQ